MKQNIEINWESNKSKLFKTFIDYIALILILTIGVCQLSI